ncbi:hypothetical protein CDC15_10115, partial [Pseudomonas aeruginosa]
DLGPLFSGYFDTTSGPKRESASYARFAGAIGLPAAEIGSRWGGVEAVSGRYRGMSSANLQGGRTKRRADAARGRRRRLRLRDPGAA